MIIHDKTINYKQLVARRLITLTITSSYMDALPLKIYTKASLALVFSWSVMKQHGVSYLVKQGNTKLEMTSSFTMKIKS